MKLFTGERNFSLGTRPALDGLRGLALAMVVAVHYSALLPWLERNIRGGFISVEMFFVLSGFLITAIALQEHDRTGDVNLRSFYTRRAYRLLPALYLAVLGCFILGQIHTVQRFESTGNQLIVGLSVLVYAFNLITAWLPHPLPIWAEPMWTLCVEIHFYMLWPPILRWAAKKSDALIVGCLGVLVAVGVAFRIVAFTLWGDPYQTIVTFSRLDGLAMGGLAAVAMYRGFRVPPRLRGFGVIGLGLLAVLTELARVDEKWFVFGGYTVVNVTTALILIDALDGSSLTAKILSVRPLRILGEWSYSLYLWHLPVFFIIGTWWYFGTWLPLFATIGTLLIAGLSTNFVEAPIRRIGQRRKPSAPRPNPDVSPENSR